MDFGTRMKSCSISRYDRERLAKGKSYCRGNCDIESSISELREYGYAVFPEYFSPSALAAINHDFDRLFVDDSDILDRVGCTNGLQVRTYIDRLLASEQSYEGIVAVVGDTFVAQVISGYMNLFPGFRIGQDKVSARLEVEHNRQVGESCNSRWHVDRVPSVKISVYLHDTDCSKGALEVVPGSHWQMRKYILEQLQKDPNPLRLANYIRDNASFEFASLEGIAGTLIILDTMCIHRGGKINAGYERRNLRAISWARPLHAGYFADLRHDGHNRSNNLEFEGYRSPAAGEHEKIPTKNMFQPS